jgi:hypothetical protein
MFFSEYGNSSHQPRLFHETTALYSPAMSRVFSGGCVYEFWQSSNGYGLVEMLEHGSSRRMPAHRKESDDESKIAERRERDGRTLLVLKDFVNYKTSLAEISIEDVEAGVEGAEREGRQEEIGAKAKYRVPENCVDWGQIEESLRK